MNIFLWYLAHYYHLVVKGTLSIVIRGVKCFITNMNHYQMLDLK